MEEKKKKVIKRKKLNLSVKRELQIWMLSRISGVVIVCTLVAVLILYFYARQEVSSSFYSAHIQIRRVSDLLLPVIAAGAFVSLLSGMALALFLPQKIAGPLYRIQKSLEAVREGDLTERVVLRKDDTLMDVADSVNETVESLRGKIEDIKKIQFELDQTIATLEHLEMRAVSERQNKALQALRTREET